jgi:hypothetical protein
VLGYVQRSCGGQARKGVGAEFAHSTGHGIGSYLSVRAALCTRMCACNGRSLTFVCISVQVHEGPQALAGGSNTPLAPGMVVSDEPGQYIEGQFGVRIESALMVHAAQQPEQLGFKYLTLVSPKMSLQAGGADAVRGTTGAHAAQPDRQGIADQGGARLAQRLPRSVPHQSGTSGIWRSRCVASEAHGAVVMCKGS